MKISGAAAVFPVSDIGATLRYYTEVLGFKEEFRGEQYAIVERDGAVIHFSLRKDDPPGAGAVYVFCDEVDGYYEELVTRGAFLDAPPVNLPYGMRDFVVFDPDKNKLFFGCAVKAS